MASPFGCLFGLFFAFLAILFVAILNIVGRVRDIIRSFSPKKRGKASSDNTAGRTASSGQARNSPRGSRKIFDDNEGEYVDYEEIQ